MELMESTGQEQDKALGDPYAPGCLSGVVQRWVGTQGGLESPQWKWMDWSEQDQGISLDIEGVGRSLEAIGVRQETPPEVLGWIGCGGAE